jgi:hypothetical protein
MIALPIFQSGDDFTRTGDYEEPRQSPPTVSEEHAVRDILALIFFESERAFGQDRTWWLEYLRDESISLEEFTYGHLFAPMAYPHFGETVRVRLKKFVGIKANALLKQQFEDSLPGEMDDEETERQELAQ